MGSKCCEERKGISDEGSDGRGIGPAKGRDNTFVVGGDSYQADGVLAQ